VRAVTHKTCSSPHVEVPPERGHHSKQRLGALGGGLCQVRQACRVLQHQLPHGRAYVRGAVSCAADARCPGFKPWMPTANLAFGCQWMLAHAVAREVGRAGAGLPEASIPTAMKNW